MLLFLIPLWMMTEDKMKDLKTCWSKISIVLSSSTEKVTIKKKWKTNMEVANFKPWLGALHKKNLKK